MMRKTRITRRSLSLAAWVALATLVLSAPAIAQPGLAGTENGEWRYWGGDEFSTRYSPRDQLTAENFGDLELAWRFKTDRSLPS